MRYLMTSEPVKYMIIDNLQLIPNLTHKICGRGSKAVNGTVRICRRHYKVNTSIESVVFHKTLPNMPYMVTVMQQMIPYQYLATISNGVWTHEISWPYTGMMYLLNLCAELPPQLTYMDQHIPRTLYMCRKSNNYSTYCVLDSMTSIFIPITEPLVHIQVVY